MREENGGKKKILCARKKMEKNWLSRRKWLGTKEVEMEASEWKQKGRGDNGKRAKESEGVNFKKWKEKRMSDEKRKGEREREREREREIERERER